MIVLALDPGPVETGFATWDGHFVGPRGKLGNYEILAELLPQQLRALGRAPALAIEMVASYGMPVGREVFETCVWVGRFWQRWVSAQVPGPTLVYRKDIKLHLCGSPKAKDGNIRQALIDRLGAPGTKKAPGPTYGVSGDAWQALAVAVYHHDVNLKGAALT